jgi:DNA-binding MarR family transcriptional regulator
LSTGDPQVRGLGLDSAVRELLLLMPRIIGRIKRIPIPEDLDGLALGPRHLSLLSFLLLDGPMTVSELAVQLEVAPTTVSLMVGELSRQHVVDRAEDHLDRRRKVVSINESRRAAIEKWLSGGALAWREALEPLTPHDRAVLVQTLRAYHELISDES